jgi:hypothetical protein
VGDSAKAGEQNKRQATAKLIVFMIITPIKAALKAAMSLNAVFVLIVPINISTPASKILGVACAFYNSYGTLCPKQHLNSARKQERNSRRRQMEPGVTDQERKELDEKSAARAINQPYSTEIEDREAEKAQKEKPAPPAATDGSPHDQEQ